MKSGQKINSFVGMFVLVLAVASAGFLLTDYQLRETSAEESVEQIKVQRQAIVRIADGEESSDFRVNYRKGESAFDVLQTASANEGFAIEYDEYDFGVLINAIGGLASDAGEGKYWMFYVNDAMSMVGADAYQPKPGDVVEFRYAAM